MYFCRLFFFPLDCVCLCFKFTELDRLRVFCRLLWQLKVSFFENIISLIVCQLKNFEYYNLRLPFVVVNVATSVMTQSPHAGNNVLSHYKKIPNEKANFSIITCKQLTNVTRIHFTCARESICCKWPFSHY